MHGAGGNVLFLWSLARALAGTRPVFGFQAHGVDGAHMPDASIESMAARYVEELRAHANGPFILGGYSGGGIDTFEMVRQLRALGEDVPFVVFFDSVPPGKADPSFGPATRNLLGNIRRHGVTSMKPFITTTTKNWLRKYLPGDRFREAEHENDKRELGLADVGAAGFVNLYYYFTAAAERYRMSSVDVDALVLKAEWVWPTHPHDYHRGRHITGTNDDAEVPGDHNAMFFPEHAPRLAETLQNALAERGY